MVIVFHVGYYKRPWNFNSLKEYGLGGSEKSVILICEELALNHNVYVVGSVIEGTSTNNVRYVPFGKMKDVPLKIDLLVGVSYIHFLKYYEAFDVAKRYFWLHNTDYYPWYNGEELDPSIFNLKSNDIHKVVCLTEWHKQKICETYGLYADKILVIPNPIDIDSFHHFKEEDKIPYSFIYTSHAERGLDKVLNEWPNILERYPKASLHISTPEYGYQYFMDYFFHKMLLCENATFYGTLAQDELYNLMSKCQIWYYPTDYEETFCITAIEMMAHGVRPVTSLKASLKEVVGEKNFDNYDLALETFKNQTSLPS